MKNYLYIQFEKGDYMYFKTPDVQFIVYAVQMFIDACDSINLNVDSIKINLLELRNEKGFVIEKVDGKTININEWLHEIKLRTADSYVKHIEEMWGDIGGMKKMEELAKAKRENRIISLPVPLGTEVYRITKSFCEYRENDKCNDWCNGWDTECEKYAGRSEVIKSTFRIGDISCFGKTVFLTEKEAKDAADSNHNFLF